MTDLDDIKQFPGLDSLLGISIVEAGGSKVVLTWTVRPELLQPFGIVHGGVHCSAVESAASVHAREPRDVHRILRDGFVVALLNPKTAIFFAAFLPQFMNADGNAALQSVLLGVAFVAMQTTARMPWICAARATPCA